MNLQGDVFGLINASGTLVARYTYNAWGELTYSSGTMAEINPLRYRGYYYDTETGFYYLQSRYYDPVTHRFINADSIAYTGQGFTGTNMFAYCNNSPVMHSDHTGHILKPFTVAICDGGGGNVEDDDSQEERTIFEELCTAIYMSLEFEAGVGMGYEAEVNTLFDLTSAYGGIKGNFVQVTLDDGVLTFGEEMNVDIEYNVLYFFEGGYWESTVITSDGERISSTDSDFFREKETLSLFGFSYYLFGGCSVDISINGDEFWDNIKSVFGG